MIAYAAVDIQGGAVVQLVGGDPNDTRVRLDDPVRTACQWEAAGFTALHVVDLDAALGLGGNRAVIHEIMKTCSIPVQVGGGVRDDAAVDFWLECGASSVVVGTRAIGDRAWLMRNAARNPGRVTVAADTRAGCITINGWKTTAGLSIGQYMQLIEDVPLAAVLCTDVDREGRMTGVDVEMFRSLVQSTGHAVIASGGIATTDDLAALHDVGAAGAVLGMALYTGALHTSTITRIYTS